MSSVSEIVYGFFQALYLLIIIWCLLSWIPNIRWHEQPFKTLDMIVQPIITPFRKIIPPGITGPIDCSPIIALLALQLAQQVILSLMPH